jgi:hypothetical protein
LEASLVSFGFDEIETYPNFFSELTPDRYFELPEAQMPSLPVQWSPLGRLIRVHFETAYLHARHERRPHLSKGCLKFDTVKANWWLKIFVW